MLWKIYFQFAVIVAVIASGLTGCSTTGKRVRCYDGPVRPTNEVALLKVQRKVFQNSAIVQTVDDMDIRKGKSLNTAKEIELIPGSHSVGFCYIGSGGGTSVSNATLTFTAEAGGVYELHVAPIDEGAGKAFSLALSGGHFYWTGWIIDANTKNVLAGKPREDPLRWYEK